MTIGLDGMDYLTYEEFETELKKLGLWLRGKHIVNVSGSTIASFGRDEMYLLDTDYVMFIGLRETIKAKLLYLLARLVSTPIDKRETEKQYRYRLPGLNEKMNYINLREEDNEFYVSTKNVLYGYRTTFTDSEVKALTPEQQKLFGMAVKEEVE